MKNSSVIRISVRNLVEFILRSGNIDNRRSTAPDNGLAEGGRIHRMIQRRMGANYRAEVTLKHVVTFENYEISVEGRADGIIEEANLFTIDEIKCTYGELSRIHKPIDVHLAQAKCYAYIYACLNDLSEMGIQMTYCNIETEEIKYFKELYSFFELKLWFEGLLDSYKKWADLEFEWTKIRQQSIKDLNFPFTYREGQKDLVTYVYQTIYHKKKLFIEAPTGVGKTISTVFPAIKAMGEGMGDKLFYLTAKTITRTVASDTFAFLREVGLRFKSVVLTAKDKICFLEETECNPEACQYAKGHLDRINDAIYDLLIHEECYSRELIEEYARKHQVCPFEMSLDISLFSDGIICDYNYLFDPHVFLKRFFSEGYTDEYLFLIDEAHNLLDRGREMYSAILYKEDFLALKKVVKEYDTKMEKQLEKCNRELLVLKRECEDCQIVEYIDDFVNALIRLYTSMDQYLTDHEESPIRKEVLDFYFKIGHFLLIYEKVDDHYVMYTEMEADGGFLLKLFCVNPTMNLKECMDKGRSSVLFSATLLPMQYYMSLLGGTDKDYAVYAKSTFDSRKRALLIGSDVTTKYTRRTEDEFYKIASYLHEIVSNRHGNYMIFFPSHSFMGQVFEIYNQHFLDPSQVECILQSDYMSEMAREEFLGRFSGNEECNLDAVIHMEIETEEEKSLLGFCVLGGIFSEGIDLKEDRLIGAIIVGTGIPQVCNERELIKGYFDNMGQNGFDYAYRIPGMNKVAQAAGRVIRTSNDTGIIALLDERFLQSDYIRMFPKEWIDYEVVTKEKIAKRVERFWDEWL